MMSVYDSNCCMASARHRHDHTRRHAIGGKTVYGRGDCLLTHPTNAAAAASFAQVGCKVALRSPCLVAQKCVTLGEGGLQ